MEKTPTYIRTSKNGFYLEVIVAPKASRNSILGEYKERIKIALTAPPLDGKANEALIEFLSKLLKTPKRDISITKGLTSKQKTLFIEGVSLEEFRKVIR